MKMATAMADGDGDGNGNGKGNGNRMADGNATEMVVAIVDGNRNGNGQWQRQRQWAIATATVKTTATELATATRWQRQWQWQRPQQGQPLQRKGCLFMWRQCAVLLDGQHLASTPMDTRKVHSPALHHGGDTAESVCSPSRGRVPDSSPCIVFVYFLQLMLVY